MCIYPNKSIPLNQAENYISKIQFKYLTTPSSENITKIIRQECFNVIWGGGGPAMAKLRKHQEINSQGIILRN